MSSQGFKLVLLGEGRVGKTSLVSRFTNDKFSDTEVSTMQANMYSKKKVEVEGKSYEINIWDTAGQERFHALGPIYYRNSNGAILVYDITDGDTFEKVKMWIKELRNVVGDHIKIVICGNKCDMEKDRDIDTAVAEKFAKKQGALHFNTSAKLNMHVTDAFQALVESIVRDGGGSGGGGSGVPVPGRRGGGGGGKKRGVKIDTAGTGKETAPVVETDGAAAMYDDAGDGGADPYSSSVASSSPPKKASRSVTLGAESPDADGAGKKKKKKEGGCCGK